MQVHTSSMAGYFKQYDIDGNKKLDKHEIAKGSLNLLGKEDASGNPDPQAKAAGHFFATMVIGGKDNKGLFPDFDKDNAVSQEELDKLAAFSGDKSIFESSDFQTAFPDQADPTGANALSNDEAVSRLSTIARGNLEKFKPNPQDPGAFRNSLRSLLPPKYHEAFDTLFPEGQPMDAVEGQGSEAAPEAPGSDKSCRHNRFKNPPPPASEE